MKNIILEKLIYKNYLKTSLSSILFIEIALIILYFNVSSNMINKSVELLLTNIRESTNELVRKEMHSIERKFSEIEVHAKLLQKEHEYFFKNQDNINVQNNVNFAVSNNGMYYKTNNNGGSSLVVSKDTVLSDELKTKITKTEFFDRTFKSLVEFDDDIVAVYFNSYTNFNRYYPFLDNVHQAFPPNINMQNYNFYYEADKKHNPEKKVVWTDVYLDPAGQGWLLSAIVPIYKGEFLEGVTGIDLTVNKFIKNFLDIEFPHEGKSFILNENGKIVAMPKDIEKILNIKEVDTYNYSKNETIDKTILKSDKFNIFYHEDKELANTFNSLINYNTDIDFVIIKGEKYLLFSTKAEKMSWYIITLIKEENVLKEVRVLEKEYQGLGYKVIGFVVFFYFLFFLYLYFKAKDFVNVLNKPIQKIIELTKNLGKTNEVVNLESCGIVEIDKLNDNFNTLSKELNNRTQKLVEAETQKAFNKKLANTDALTGVYNRRFLAKFSKKYMNDFNETASLSLLILDIDNFKDINDTYGHDIGDVIIKKLVNIIKIIIRSNDYVVRYGGDEFVVLLPNANIDNAKRVGNKILELIHSKNKEESAEKLFFTISIGSAEIKKEDIDIENIISRADLSLYEAKKLGKDCLI